jgi:hypothetical protein
VVLVDFVWNSLAKIKHRFIEIDDTRRFVLVYVRLNIMIYIVGIHFLLVIKLVLTCIIFLSLLTSYMYKWLKIVMKEKLLKV